MTGLELNSRPIRCFTRAANRQRARVSMRAHDFTDQEGCFWSGCHDRFRVGFDQPDRSRFDGGDRIPSRLLASTNLSQVLQQPAGVSVQPLWPAFDQAKIRIDERKLRTLFHESNSTQNLRFGSSITMPTVV